MELNKVYIVLKEDILYYPPIISLINSLINLNKQVVLLGIYSDSIGQENLKRLGVKFVDVGCYNVKANPITKLFQIIKFRYNVYKFLKNQKFEKGDRIWLAHNENVLLFSKLLKKYPTIIHQIEFTSPKINWKYRMFNPMIKLKDLYNLAEKIVCCEYNRAQITKAFFNLSSLPYILPNKTKLTDIDTLSIPNTIKEQIYSAERLAKTKKIILYQGVFSSKERRLEEFCQCLDYLSTEYIMIVMGRGSSYFEDLRNKYSGNRIYFIPFIAPPYYLKITQLAHIGVLSYHGSDKDISTVINPLYCAPNKIFEYAKFGVPMIANDIPGLHYIFKEFNCGVTVPAPMNPQQIAEAVSTISSDYFKYSEGAKKYYKSVDVDRIINDVLT